MIKRGAITITLALLSAPALAQQTGAGGGSSSTGANPTAAIATAAVNGSATTFMRSDAAPAMGNLTGDVTSAGLATTLATVTPGKGGSGVANTGNLTWNAAQTFSFTSGQTMTFPATSDTLDGLGTAATLTAAKTFSAAGAASTPGVKVSGARFAGTGTTSFPQFYVNESTATASTTLSTGGTGLGVNIHSASGNIFSGMVDGVEKFSVTSAGALSVANSITAGTNFQVPNGGVVFWGSRSQFKSPADGRMWIQNNAPTQGIGFDFTGIPVVTGTGSPTIATGSTDTAGEVTAGASATSVVITFNLAKTNAPFCTVTDQGPSLASFTYTISTTAITITQTANSGNLIDYVCITRPN